MKALKNALTELFQRHPDYYIGHVSSSSPLKIEQIRKYKDKLRWTQDDYGFFMFGLSSNTNLPWTKELIEEFIDRWDWSSISAYIFGKCVWFDGIFDKYKDKISWNDISYNSDIPWTMSLIDKYKEDIVWSQFSGNNSIPWSPELIKKYEHKIDFHALSNNISSPFNQKLLFTKKIGDRILPLNESIDLIKQYEDKLDWHCLLFDWENGLSKEVSDEIFEDVMSEIPDKA